jgi:hypothetical protein
LRNTSRILFLTFAILLLSLPLSAHHGSAAYAMEQSVSVKGDVVNFQFVNPHVLIFIESKNDKGEVEKWQGELTSPNRLNRAGWNHNTFKVGDEITLIGAPAKSGAHSLWLTKVLGTDGQPVSMAMGN